MLLLLLSTHGAPTRASIVDTVSVPWFWAAWASKPPAQRKVVDEAGTPSSAPLLRRETTCHSITSMGKMEPSLPWFITTATPIPGRGQEKVHLNSGVKFWTQSMSAGNLRAATGSQGSPAARGGCGCPDAHQGTRQPSLAESSLLESSSLVLSDSSPPPGSLPTYLSRASPPFCPSCLPARDTPDSALQGKTFFISFFSYYKITCGYCRQILKINYENHQAKLKLTHNYFLLWFTNV